MNIRILFFVPKEASWNYIEDGQNKGIAHTKKDVADARDILGK